MSTTTIISQFEFFFLRIFLFLVNNYGYYKFYLLFEVKLSDCFAQMSLVLQLIRVSFISPLAGSISGIVNTVHQEHLILEFSIQLNKYSFKTLINSFSNFFSDMNTRSVFSKDSNHLLTYIRSIRMYSMSTTDAALYWEESTRADRNFGLFVFSHFFESNTVCLVLTT